MSEFLDRLLRADLPNVRKDLPTKQVEIPRLSRLAGGPAVVTLTGLPYGRVQELRRIEDPEIHILLAGCPELRDEKLMAKFGAATPADLVTAMLLPGEVADLSREVERLCGYRQTTIREVKNGSEQETTRT